MIHFLYLLIIAVTNNLDNIGVRIAYSMRGIRISAPINAWISAITLVISYSAAYLGTVLSAFLSKQWCSVIAMVLLTAIGSWMILMQCLKKVCNGDSGKSYTKDICHILLKPENADMDNSKHIDFKEATLLGVALSLNNVGGGISAGMIGLNSFWVGLLSAALSYIALWSGNHVAEYFLKWKITDRATVAAGLLLIAIGIEQII